MGKRSKRRQEAKLKRAMEHQDKGTVQPEIVMRESTAPKAKGIKGIYEGHYKRLLLIPFIILLAALLQLGYQQATTGDFLTKDVSLKGGMTVTIPTSADIDLGILELALQERFPDSTYTLRKMTSFGNPIGLIVSSDIAEDQRDGLIDFLVEETDVDRKDISIEEIGSSLGNQFFKQTLIAILIAFFFMGTVVLLYFRKETKHFKGWAKLWGLVPSGAVILSAFSDMVVTLAIANLLGINLSTAGIAAFLMLIGYSVDTDILLTIRVIKYDEGSVWERIYGAIKTGLTMNMTTLAAVSVSFLLSESPVLRQIMTILFIGLLVDMLNTWVQNVGIIRWYMERKQHGN